MRSTFRFALRVLRLPVDDYLNALGPSLGRAPLVPLIVMVLSFVVSWWIYVPVHELLHVAGCLLGGGEVTRLEIDPIYGAALLQHLFPFVAVGSDYAGQLTGFDTRGSDLTYLLTDFLPFALTILIGVPLLRSSAREPHGWRGAAKLGASLPIAFAPFISLPGDYYEMGSILMSRLFSEAGWPAGVERWRGDDFSKQIDELFFSGGSFATVDVIGVGASVCLAIALALATYALGTAWARYWQGIRSANRVSSADEA